MIRSLSVIVSFGISSLLFLNPIATAAQPAECANQKQGSWFSLENLTTLKIGNDCKFKILGPGCNSIGNIVAPLEEQGTVEFKTTEISENSHCPFHGSHTCKYVMLDTEMLLDCGETSPTTLIKENSNSSIGEVSYQDKKDNLSHLKRLAVFYLTKNNAKESAKLLKKIADAKDKEAYSALGLAKFYGSNGFKKSPLGSLKWSLLAAEKGVLEAQFVLGLQYLRGEGTKKNISSAKKWLEKAATSKYVAAQKELGLLYESGQLGGNKKEEARYWLRQAADQGDAHAERLFAQIDSPKTSVATEPAKLMSSEDRAISSDPRYTESGNVISQELLKDSKNLGFFQLRPYLAVQQNKATVPSFSLGISPTFDFKLLTLRPFAAISLLNVAIGNTFVSYELAMFTGLKVGDALFEIGYGMEKWPAPSGTAPNVQFSLGKVVDSEALVIPFLKTISLGYSQTFFDDQVHKVFLGATF